MKVLCIAPHADDETIGLGGTLARHVAQGDEVTVAVMTGHGEERPHPVFKPEDWDTVRGEAREAMRVLGVQNLLFEEIPAVEVAAQPLWKLNGVVAKVIAAAQPEVLYVPFPFDMHKDHRELFHAASVAWRPVSETGRGIREVHCYEVLSETHWNVPYVEAGFLPQTFVDVSSTLERKMEALACYRSQIRPAPDARSLEAIRALAVWRGSLVGVAAAEALVTVRQLR